MKKIQAISMLVVLSSFLLCCKKEAQEPSIPLTASYLPMAGDTGIFFPADGSVSTELKTNIILSLRSLDFSSIQTVQVTVSGKNGRVKGKTEVSNAEIIFTPNLELGPLENYKVLVKMVVKTASNDTRIVHVNGGIPSLRKDTTHLNFSWRFTTRKAYSYSMHKTSSWVTLFNRDGNKVMQVGDYLYSYGGWTADPLESHNDVYRSTGDLTEWEQVHDAPWVGRHTYGIGKLDSNLYIFGGDHLSEVFDVWKTVNGVDFSQVTQDMQSRMGPRLMYGACVHNSKLYILGGQSSGEEGAGLTDVWAGFNGALWKRIASGLPFLGKNISGCAASFNGRIWVVGGGYYTDNFSSRVYTNEIYSSEDGITWQREPDGPWLGRQYADLCVWNNRLWMIAGCNTANLSDIWYMTDDGEWHELETPADFEPRHASGVGVYNDKLVIVCGNYHNDCWVIEKQ